MWYIVELTLHSYQPGGSSGFNGDSDPLSNGKACMRDAAIMQRLGVRLLPNPFPYCGLLIFLAQVNTIRVYNLSPALVHDECASIFNAAGIHMIIDVNSPLPGGALDRTDPAKSYNPAYFHQVYGVIESFKNYPNTLAFFSGNEVINEQSHKSVPAYIRVCYHQ